MKILRLALVVAIMAAIGIIKAQAEENGLAVKKGLWEANSVTDTQGTQPFPADILARIPADKRAGLTAPVDKHGVTATHRYCSVSGKIDLNPDVQKNGAAENSCGDTVIKQTATVFEGKLECKTPQGININGEVHMEVVDANTVRETSSIVWANDTNKLTRKSTFVAKWLGETCSGNERKF